MKNDLVIIALKSNPDRYGVAKISFALVARPGRSGNSYNIQQLLPERIYVPFQCITKHLQAAIKKYQLYKIGQLCKCQKITGSNSISSRKTTISNYQILALQHNIILKCLLQHLISQRSGHAFTFNHHPG
jgi:hypothetical protein